MRAGEKTQGTFEKVGECLYRYTANGKYYARFEVKGKEVRRSLGTTDKATAKRKLGDLQRSMARTTGEGDKLSLAQLCDRYMATMRGQAPKTIYRKEAIVRRIKADWPGGADVAITKVVQLQVSAWLALYEFGVPSYNLHLLFIGAEFDLAVADRLITDSESAQVGELAEQVQQATQRSVKLGFGDQGYTGDQSLRQQQRLQANEDDVRPRNAQFVLCQNVDNVTGIPDLRSQLNQRF